MKIYGTSDLHLDINPLMRDQTGKLVDHDKNAPFFEDHKNDTLLIAGDTAEVQAFVRREIIVGIDAEGKPEIGRAKSPVMNNLETICANYKHVVLIFGNHEFYNEVIDHAFTNFKEMTAHIKNLTVLENETIVLDDTVKIVGTVMWTDLKKRDSTVMNVVQRNMNDYFYIGKITNDPTELDPVFRRLIPDDTADLFDVAKDFLTKEIQAHTTDMPLIVMTHHAPIMNHANPQRRGGTMDYVDFAYATAQLDNLILDNDKKIDVWFHGHTHDHKRTEVGDTVVVTKARGYHDKAFDPVLLLDTEIK
jgi:UDP-2,3-diacylglucosamine pyrophosphatase LpxH